MEVIVTGIGLCVVVGVTGSAVLVGKIGLGGEVVVV